MARTHRFSTTAVIVCFLLAQWRGTLAASELPPLSKPAPASPSAVDVLAQGQELTSATVVAADGTDDQPLDREADPLRVAERPRLTLPDRIFRDSLFPGAVGGHVWRGTAAFPAGEADSLAQRRGYRGRGGGRNDASRAEILLGAVGVIAGTAVLVYANRPECRANAGANGCGYGTKVAGSAVLSAGIVGLLVGALTWR
jgi:hypothetical protein